MIEVGPAPHETAKNPRDALFLTTEEIPGLRNYSERSFFVMLKDGGQVLYDRGYAIEWKRRVDFSLHIGRYSLGTIKEVARAVGINYAILSAGSRTGLPVVFRNEGYMVVAFPSGSGEANKAQ